MKTITLYHPNAIRSMLDDFDHCFDPIFGHPFWAPAAKTSYRVPAVNIQETDKLYRLEMELPGFDEKDIEVQVEGNTLFINSKQEEVKDEKKDDEAGKETYILHERHRCDFNRSFKLPENADPAAIDATFKNGILKLEIKKQAEAQKRAIQINVA